MGLTPYNAESADDGQERSNPLGPVPPDVEAELRARWECLPSTAVNSITDYLAVSRNESRFVRRVGCRLGLSPHEIEALARWHSEAVTERLPTVRPTNDSYRVLWMTLHRSPRSKIARLLVPVWSNPVTIGLPSWLSNRRVEMRALKLRLTGAR